MSEILIECVPNFSEGSDPKILDAITSAITSVSGIRLLDVDPGVAANRTVYTFVGQPEAVLEAAFRSIRVAQQMIDMRKHQGEHPRMGATDVCPLIPVRGIGLEECAVLAKQLAERVSNELHIPTFLYEAAATAPHRRRLPDLRKGEYEALSGKLGDSKWGSDFGPREWSESVAKSGGTVIGARPFLIAWNINLNTKNQRKAEKIASIIREKGALIRENGELVMGEDGEYAKKPGMFKHVNAIGWTIEEYGRCQISCNMTDFTKTSLHEVFNAVQKLAVDEGVIVTGSELVGLVPIQALLDAGKHYLTAAGENPGIPERDLLQVAIRSLGLADLKPFDPQKSVVEYQISPDGPLVSLTVRGFSDLLSSDAPAPGGGSVAALCGALSVSLSAMVSQLSTKINAKNWPYGQPRPDTWTKFDDMAHGAQAMKERFLHDVDADTEAFDSLMAAMKLPKETKEQEDIRKQSIKRARRQAIETPLGVLRRCVQALDCAEIALQGNPNARSDAGVAVSLARTCAEGAWMNVRINLQSLQDQQAKQQYAQEADALLATIQSKTQVLFAMVQKELIGE